LGEITSPPYMLCSRKKKEGNAFFSFFLFFIWLHVLNVGNVFGEKNNSNRIRNVRPGGTYSREVYRSLKPIVLHN